MIRYTPVTKAFCRLLPFSIKAYKVLVIISIVLLLNFKNASLSVIDNNTIEIITKGEIHKAFIENEWADLILHLQNYFCNRLLVYRIVVIEDTTEVVEPMPP